MTDLKKAPSGNYARRANRVTGCPLTAALAAIGGKWKMIIVYFLAQKPHHFAALKQATEISQKVLTQQLRELISDGIVHRQPTGAAPAPVDYSLTDYGRSVLPLVEHVRQGGRQHMDRDQ